MSFVIFDSRKLRVESLRRTGHLSSVPPPPFVARRAPLADAAPRAGKPRGSWVNPSILFIFSLFYVYSSLEYVHSHAIYRVNQAKYGIRILLAASQEYVNIYSTCRVRREVRRRRYASFLSLYLLLPS